MDKNKFEIAFNYSTRGYFGFHGEVVDQQLQHRLFDEKIGQSPMYLQHEALIMEAIKQSKK